MAWDGRRIQFGSGLELGTGHSDLIGKRDSVLELPAFS
jgi:hypothetical protein